MKFKNIHIIIIFIFLITSSLLSSQERCGTTIHMLELANKYPEYAKARAKTKLETKEWIQRNQGHQLKTIIKIPVVVHVVWNTNAENISDAQVFSQIQILNNDFRRNNADTVNTPNVWQNIAADCEIEFCLATTDPNGISTTGINRVQTSESSFGMSGDPVMSSSSGGANPWSQDHYLNIWVCDLGSGLLGYASQPSWGSNPKDGVVIGYKYFGNTGTAQPPYHKGRTATHEIGHWLNLDHVWGDGWGSNGCNVDDGITDTPNQEEENYSCPGFPHNASACGTNNGDMFMNYMDYTNDACMNLFTLGQKDEMIAAINLYRSDLLNHNLCEGGASNIIDIISAEKELIKIITILGKEINKSIPNTPLFYIYKDGSVKKQIILQ